MTVPKGTIWQKLRSDCLSSVPQGVATPYRLPSTLNTWRKSGTYSIQSHLSRRTIFITAPVEIGSALLADAEHLLDHAAEHQVAVHHQVFKGNTFSPTWGAVTVYYWGFFATLALTRLLGNTVWFLDDEAAKDLTALGPGQTGKLGAGTYQLECRTELTATNREVHLHRKRSRLHDCLWSLLAEYLSAIFKSHGNKSTFEEYELFNSLVVGFQKLGTDWPSTLRNSVNYRLGCGYGLVRNRESIDLLAYLRKTDSLPTQMIVEEFNRILRSLNPGNHGMASNPGPYCRLLLLLTLLVQNITNELHEELIDRHSLDRRWMDARSRFLHTHCNSQKCSIWPNQDI